jgi:hypothetical protein
VFQGPAARDNAGNNVDILLNVHDVFERPAARDNAGNNVDILLNVHETRHEHLIDIYIVSSINSCCSSLKHVMHI